MTPIINYIDKLEEAFLRALKEFSFFFIFNLRLSHISLALVLFFEMLIDFFHLLGCAVELECNDPS